VHWAHPLRGYTEGGVFVFALLSCNLVACHFGNAFRQCSQATSHDIPLVSSKAAKSSTC